MTKSALRFAKETSQIVCLSPCVCYTPRGGKMVPVAYMITSKLAWSDRTIDNVAFGEEQAFTMDSRTARVTGNEAGTGGGVASGVNVGWCRPQSNKTSFFVAGEQVVQDDCLFEMNCDGPYGPYNTLGKIAYSDKK